MRAESGKHVSHDRLVYRADQLTQSPSKPANARHQPVLR